MPRRRIGYALVLPALVGASTLVHWLAARRFDGFWIMPDEAIYARRGLELWEHGRMALLHGEGAGYGVLYPALAGATLALGDFATGYHSLKLLQALTMSLAAVPVFFWARRMTSPAWSLAAAALTLCSPLLLYSGLVMTEVLYYPVAALALGTVALAVERATVRAQVLALAVIALAFLTRVQGIVLVAVFALAVLLDAAFARSPRRLRRFWPLWATLAAGAVVTLATPGVFGSYAEVVGRGYPVADSLRLTAWHAGWIVVATGFVPAAALLLLAGKAAAGRERDPAVRALGAVAVAAVVLVVAQVGMFAARYAPHLLERDLAALPPVLFVVLAVWLGRGGRPRVFASVVAFGLLALVVALPWGRLDDVEALPDTFGLVILDRLQSKDPAAVVAIAGAVLLAAFALVPWRLRAVLPVLVGGVLIAASVAAADQVAARIRYDQVNLVGSPRDWIDRGAGGGRVAYLYDGERYFNGVWQAVLWNDRIDRVVSLGRTRVPGPMPQESLATPADGRLRFPERYVVASTPHAFVGRPVASIEQLGEDVGGLTLWRLDPPARLATIRRGIRPDGDMTEPGHVRAYDCAGGRLELTLLPKATNVVTVLLDGRVALRERIGGLEYWNGTVNVPPSPSPRVCRFTIVGESLLGSTRIEFVHR